MGLSIEENPDPYKRILACGSRAWTDVGRIEVALAWLAKAGVTTVLHGGAQGADTIAGDIAKKMGLEVEVFIPDWDLYGKQAGFVRNKQMVDTGPDLVLAFVKGESRGTSDTVTRAREAEIKVLTVYDHGGVS